ncbi:dipeptide ABC transporter ATP-binding protein [Naumannella halotolerans]|uniref:dipeptide ABC transporter ATP-binding protein n=1 Tax=Naumannella halotolerans TaxID=993414 RepID=UPI00370D6BF2
MRTVLGVEDLNIGWERGALVRGVSFSVGAGERVGLIGESGSGKSLTALGTIGLLPQGLRATGAITLGDHRWQAQTAKESALARLRGKTVSMVFQEPMTALNPTMRVGEQVAEVMVIHHTVESRAAARRRAVELLGQVGLADPEQAARAYPHQLSGGQRQRVVIAIAMANHPALLICDEPTTALDVTVQARILDQIVRSVSAEDAALLLITHDLAVVATVCERVLVMNDGEIVEQGTVEQVLTDPQHPYTRKLIAASELSPKDPGEVADPRPMVTVRSLTRQYRRSRASVLQRAPVVDALQGLDFEVSTGERFGIVGESGSGKSTLLRILAGLDQPTSGTVHVNGTQITGLSERRLVFLRDELQLVFQDPAGSLDPRMRVADIIGETLRRETPAAKAARAAELLEQVGLPPESGRRFPHQFSGGQRQRISIARALAPRPSILLADEPVSALDVSVRAQVLDLISDLVDDLDLTLIFVSHDLSVVRHLCDRMAVMHRGRIVELGPVERIWADPADPYTRQLITAVPDIRRALDGGGTEDLLLPG